MGLSQRRRGLIRRLRSRKTREREGAVLVEGVRAVGEALAANARIRFAVVSPRLETAPGGTALGHLLAASGVVADVVSDDELTALSDTEHPQGILLACSQPEAAGRTCSSEGRYLVLDRVQDPGNAGTLVRAAAAFGLDAVFALEGTVDLWGTKAVRASAGMIFRTGVAVASVEDLATARKVGVRILVADPTGVNVARECGGAGWMLVMGNEGAGPRDDLIRLAAERVSVPMPGPAESLNVGMAGAILLYALTRETVRG